MFDLCVIGAGPAGLTAAIYALRAGKSVLVLEALNYGGQIVTTHEIENYPALPSVSGYDFANALYSQALALGMEFEYEKAEKIEKDQNVFLISGKEKSYEAKSVILALGVKRRKLGVPGEERLAGMGVSYCGFCDGAFYKNKPVAVAGGGNTALDEALFLSNFCSRVYLLHRRDGFRGEPRKLMMLREKENVTILTDVAIQEIEGDDTVSGIRYRENKTGKTVSLEISGMFISIGQIPDTEFLKGAVPLDENGYLIAQEDCATKIPGLFAAGDCRTKKFRQLTTAASDGTVAALNTCEFLDGVWR